MSLPKRPFTTSSLTSQLKSTIANHQPLLSNLTNIEKLSSQASSLAHKTPSFFSNLTHQNQPTPAATATSQHNFSSQKPNDSYSASCDASSAAMLPQHQQHQHQPAIPAAPAAPTTPSVDLSHLTQEERMMIQSVMAKAEMADMGMPVDTSVPSSTNLPSHTSQILTQQHQQQQQQQIQRQHQQQQPPQSSQYQQQQQQTQQQQQHSTMNGNQQPQQYYPSFVNHQQQQQQQPQQQNDANKGMLNQQQQQTQQLVSQINSQFNLHQQPTADNRQQQQFQQQQQPISQSLQHQPSVDSSSQHQNQHQHQQQQNQMNSFNQPQQQPMNSQQQYTGINQQQQFPNQTSQQLQSQPQSRQQQLGPMGADQNVAENNRLMMANQQQMSSFDRQHNTSTGISLSGFDSLQQQQRQQPQYNLAPSMQQQQQHQQQHQQQQQQPRPVASTSTTASYNPTNSTAAASLQQQQPPTSAALIAMANDNHDPSSSLIVANLQQYQQQPQIGHAILSSTSQPQQYSQQLVSQPQLQAHAQAPLVLGQQMQPMSQQDPNSMLALYQQQQPNQPAQVTVLAAAPQAQQQYMLTTTNVASQPSFVSAADPEQSLSDQEYVTASRSRGQRRPVVRQHSSSSAAATARSQRSKQDPKASRFRSANEAERSLQAYDLAAGSGQSVAPARQWNQQKVASRSESKSPSVQQHSRKLPQPNQQQIDRSIQQQQQHSVATRRERPAQQQQRRKTRNQKSYDLPLEDYEEAEEDDDDDDEDGGEEEELYDDEDELYDAAETIDDDSQSNVDFDDLSAAVAASRPRKSIGHKKFNQRKSPSSTMAAKTRKVTKKSTPSPTASASTKIVDEQTEQQQDLPLAEDKTKDEALKLLSELKLSKQASEVMEQQQLLIKQSQELIKLQLEQQQLSQELKKSMKGQLSTEQPDESMEQLDKDKQQLDETSETSTKESTNAPTTTQTTSKQATTLTIESDLDRALRTNKTRLERQSLYGRKSATTISRSQRRDSESELDLDLDDAADYKLRLQARSSSSSKYQRESNLDQPPRAHSSRASPRYNRELQQKHQQSPTDTTDSDTDLGRHRSSRVGTHQSQQHHHHHRASGYQRAAQNSARRREPAGLPPSPLPVAAAIQMHQMQLLNQYRNQQQHLRSRSVTSSPNHQQQQQHHESLLASGYLTDSQQHRSTARSVSPETLSEFGGQRRRKRLPEPPSNAIPITPSMVRKMIQAQRTTSGSSTNFDSKSAPSMQASSYLSGTQNLMSRPTAGAFSSSASSSRWSSDSQPQNSTRSTFGLGSEFQTQQQKQRGSNFNPDQPQHVSFVASSEQQQQQPQASGSTGAIRFGSGPNNSSLASEMFSSYSPAVASASAGNKPSSSSSSLLFGPNSSGSILRAGNNISEVKETPELDKMINDLNEYYGLESNKSKHQPESSYQQTKYQPSTSSPKPTSNHFSGLGSSSLISGGAASRLSHLTRCNSEGEEGTLAGGRFNGAQRYTSLRASAAANTAAVATSRPANAMTGTSFDDYSLNRPLYGSSLGSSSSNFLDRTTGGKYQPAALRYNQPASSLSELRRPASTTSTNLDYLSRPAFRPTATTTTTAGDPFPSSSTSSLDHWAPKSSYLETAQPPRSSPTTAAAGADRRYHQYQPPHSTDVESILLRDRYQPASTITTSAFTRPTATMTSKFSSSLFQDSHREPHQPWSSASSSDNPATQLRPPGNPSFLSNQRDQPSDFGSSSLMSTSSTAATPGSRYRRLEGTSDTIDLLGQRRSYLRNYQHKSLDFDSSPRGAYGQSFITRPNYNAERLGSPMRSAYHHQPSGLLTTDYEGHLSSLSPSRPVDEFISTTRTGHDDRLSGYNFDHSGSAAAAVSTTPTSAALGTRGPGSNLLNFTKPTSASCVRKLKDDIIRNGPRFDSIGYRFRTENQNKYVAQPKSPPIQSFQTRYPHPYKRILLSKNPKDRIGNGIGVRIIGGQPIPSLYDKVNRCIVTSGAFVAEVFQDSNVYFMDEMHEGDQIVEWNGVNLCNRSNEEVQQILFSQFSDDEVEIVYLGRDKFNQAYGGLSASDTRQQQQQQQQHLGLSSGSSSNDNRMPFASNYLENRAHHGQHRGGGDLRLTGDSIAQDTFESFSNINKAGDSLLSAGMKQENPLYGTRSHETHMGGKSFRRKLSLSSIANMWK